MKPQKVNDNLLDVLYDTAKGLYETGVMNITTMNVFKQELLDSSPLSETEKAKIAEGVRQADAGQFASDEQVKQTFKRWGADVNTKT